MANSVGLSLSMLRRRIGDRVEVGTGASAIVGVLAEVNEEYALIIEDTGNLVHVPVGAIAHVRVL